jgi:hypothetical protein
MKYRRARVAGDAYTALGELAIVVLPEYLHCMRRGLNNWGCNQLLLSKAGQIFGLILF